MKKYYLILFGMISVYMSMFTEAESSGGASSSTDPRPASIELESTRRVANPLESLTPDNPEFSQKVEEIMVELAKRASASIELGRLPDANAILQALHRMREMAPGSCVILPKSLVDEILCVLTAQIQETAPAQIAMEENPGANRAHTAERCPGLVDSCISYRRPVTCCIGSACMISGFYCIETSSAASVGCIPISAIVTGGVCCGYACGFFDD